MRYQAMIDDYQSGPDILRQAVAVMSEEELDAKPIPGKWSTRQVVCHIADFEPIYADRMKRVIAEEVPTIFGADPDTFAATLAYEGRSLEAELDLVSAVRRHMVTILRSLQEEDFERTGNHSESGAITLTMLLANITEHIPYHVRFIAEKRQALRKDYN